MTTKQFLCISPTGFIVELHGNDLYLDRNREAMFRGVLDVREKDSLQADGFDKFVAQIPLSWAIIKVLT